MNRIPEPTPEVYEEFQNAFEFFNEQLFDSMLPPCLITLQRERHTMGYFSAGRFIRRTGEQADEIALNPAYFAVMSVQRILAVLVHEMVHMWQLYHGKPGRGRYHNKEWGYKMESIGLMPSDTGEPGGQRTGDRMTDYVIPGGPFDQLSRVYEKSFDIATWLDRFPAYIPPPAPDLTEEDVEGMPEEEVAKLREEQERLIAQRSKLEQIGVKYVIQPSNRSNRVKYRCPNCARQVWGKPGLMVACLHCEGTPQMIAVS